MGKGYEQKMHKGLYMRIAHFGIINWMSKNFFLGTNHTYIQNLLSPSLQNNW